jgi:DNA-binding Xre family transcriptional regulator
MDIAKCIRIGLGAKNMLKKDLAVKSGLNRTSLSLKMNGHRDFTVRDIEDICHGLDLSIGDFLAPALENK